MEIGALRALSLGPVATKLDSRLEKLERSFRQGIGGADAQDARTELNLDAGADDHDVATTMVQILSECGTSSAARQSIRPPSGHLQEINTPTEGADSSFLGRLSASGETDLSVHQIDDLPTLLAVVRAGSLHQRRAALHRLSERISDRRTIPNETFRLAVDTLQQLRDVDVAYELANLRERLPGMAARKERAKREEWSELLPRLQKDVRNFWDGQLGQEPLLQLPGAQRANLLLRIRDLPTLLADHICAIIEGNDGVSTLEDRIGLVASLRYGGDRRLVPSLIVALEGGPRELTIEAARALACIDDPRVQPALSSRYDRAILEEERAVIGGALGMTGEYRAADYVRGLLKSDYPLVVAAALEALQSLGGPEGASQIVQLLDHANPAVPTLAVLALGRIADGRVLDDLSQHYAKTSVPALRAQIEDALASISARMELRGEEAAVIDWSEVGQKPTIVQRDRLGARIRGVHNYVIGHLWLVLGSLSRAIARFESAAVHRGKWAPPLIAIAMSFARRGQHALALPAFRRAIEIDRARIERNPIYARAMAQCFLRRAEQVEQEGREDVARGLVGEALTFDLRWAPSAVRFELQRLHELLRREEHRHVESVA